MILKSRDDALDLSEARYYQDLLYRTLKIGAELEIALPRGIRRVDIQPLIEKLLGPSRDMNTLGRHGVFDVKKEHSGIEIQVIGRHPHWEALVGQYTRIIRPLLAKGMRMKPTCGLHFHLLCIGLAERVPEIVLANLWNMVRIFAPALKWLTAAETGWTVSADAGNTIHTGS